MIHVGDDGYIAYAGIQGKLYYKRVLRTALPFALASLALLVSVVAQRPAPPPPLRSPEVHADRTVTFRFRAPAARQVELMLEGEAKPEPMQRDAAGVWTLTVGPLLPEYYGYSFVADGVPLLDPDNPLIKPNLLNPQSMVLVPAADPEPWEATDVPHGVVEHRFYRSAVVGDNRDYYVYTPPGYDARAKTRYPVLYLLHGYSDDASGWTSVGRANYILDNLIAQGRVQPMVVVMTLGYGTPQMLAYGWNSWSHPELVSENLVRYRQALLTEVIPQVEAAYRVKTDRDDRAIAGLSMGGAESLYVGLNDLDRFSWIGSFSAGGLAKDFATQFPNLSAAANRQLHLLWIACGTSDALLAPNRAFRAWLTSLGIRHTDIETPGRHTWLVWRDNLVHFLPLLFRN